MALLARALDPQTKVIIDSKKTKIAGSTSGSI
jgi:hypothetical protein